MTENTGKFEACVAPLFRKIRRYFSHFCLHYVQWWNMLRRVNLLGLGQKLLTSLVMPHCLRELLAHFQLKKKSGSLSTLSRSLIFRLLWKQRRDGDVPLLCNIMMIMPKQTNVISFFLKEIVAMLPRLKISHPQW